MSVFDWCRTGDHENCQREYERFVIDPKSKKPVYLGETRRCECKKRGCKCYVKPADRDPVKKRKPRRKK